MIFTKATRRKDIKGVRNIQESNLDDADEQNNPKLKEPITVEDDIDRPTDDVGDAAEDVQKTRQSTINLVVGSLPLHFVNFAAHHCLSLGCRCQTYFRLLHILLLFPKDGS